MFWSTGRHHGGREGGGTEGGEEGGGNGKLGTISEGFPQYCKLGSVRHARALEGVMTVLSGLCLEKTDVH